MEKNPIDIVLRCALDAHEGQLDAAGYPRMLHSLSVGLMGHTDEEKMAGFLHDSILYGGATAAKLRADGVPYGIVAATELLTPESSDMKAHAARVISSGNPIALQVLCNDLRKTLEAGEDEELSVALSMVEKAVEEASKVSLYSFPEDPSIDVAVFACGCFWGTQHQFDKETGVLRTLAGYTGGPEENPSYADVRDHRTHHVEAVIVEFDPMLTDYTKLCQVFFEIHDPAQTDGVGPDLGPQYRSCLFWRTREQKEKAEAVIADLRCRGYEVNTLVLPFERFYVGEEYHQKYYEKTGGEPYCHLRVRKFPK